MLIPAILKKEEIQKKMQTLFYTDDMLYEVGGLAAFVPDIASEPDGGLLQYAVVDNDDKLIGYIGFRVDWYASCAYNFGMISFDAGNPIFGLAISQILKTIISEYHIHRIEWRMVGGNPVERHYDRFCSQHHGQKVVLHDVIRDRTGTYHDSVIYEIILEEDDYCKALKWRGVKEEENATD